MVNSCPWTYMNIWTYHIIWQPCLRALPTGNHALPCLHLAGLCWQPIDLHFIVDHSKQGSSWITGTSLTLYTTKRGTDLGMLVVPFLPIHPLHIQPKHSWNSDTAAPLQQRVRFLLKWKYFGTTNKNQKSLAIFDRKNKYICKVFLFL